MRAAFLLSMILALGGAAAAQDTDTHFPIGPQYLVTTDSTLFLRPIATPSLSLGETATVPGTAAPEQAPSSSVPLSRQIALPTVYWGDHGASEILGRRIVTPILSLSEAPASMSTPPGQAEIPERPSVIEITATAPLRPVPPSLFDTGVTGTTNPVSLREFGVSLGDTAAFWKSHGRKAPHVYTNADVERLHGG